VLSSDIRQSIVYNITNSRHQLPHREVEDRGTQKIPKQRDEANPMPTPDVALAMIALGLIACLLCLLPDEDFGLLPEEEVRLDEVWPYGFWMMM
jgi:hypothetical protein